MLVVDFFWQTAAKASASQSCVKMACSSLALEISPGVWHFLRRRRDDLGKGFKHHRKVVSKWLVARLRLKSALLTATVCPSGLRGWAQVPLVKTAWVQIPQLSFVVFCFLRTMPQACFKACLKDCHLSKALKAAIPLQNASLDRKTQWHSALNLAKITSAQR